MTYFSLFLLVSGRPRFSQHERHDTKKKTWKYNQLQKFTREHVMKSTSNTSYHAWKTALRKWSKNRFRAILLKIINISDLNEPPPLHPKVLKNISIYGYYLWQAKTTIQWRRHWRHIQWQTKKLAYVQWKSYRTSSIVTRKFDCK